jgi:glycerol uptake facilitator-like aquaporin
MMFVTVSVARWLLEPGSPLHVGQPRPAFAALAVVAGLVLVLLIRSPLGHRSGGHMSPSVTVALWLMDVFPGNRVLPYLGAQMAGSAAGAGLARLLWGGAVTDVGYAAVRPAPAWGDAAVFLAECGCCIVLTLVVGFFLAHPRRGRLLPWAVALSVALMVAVLGPLSGGSSNPARYFGTALFSGQHRAFWVYLLAPVLGGCLGAAVHHLFVRRFHTHRPLTYGLGGVRAGSGDD